MVGQCGNFNSLEVIDYVEDLGCPTNFYNEGQARAPPEHLAQQGSGVGYRSSSRSRSHVKNLIPTGMSSGTLDQVAEQGEGQAVRVELLRRQVDWI